MTTSTTRTRPIAMALTVAAVVAAIVAAALALDAASVPPPTADGAHTFRVVAAAADGTLTVDALQVLSGQEAVRAAVADGAIEPGEGLPNDIYIRNRETTTASLVLAPDATIALYDCSDECALVEVDRTAFLTGAARPLNGELAVFDATVADGRITTLDEIYVP